MLTTRQLLEKLCLPDDDYAMYGWKKCRHMDDNNRPIWRHPRYGASVFTEVRVRDICLDWSLGNYR